MLLETLVNATPALAKLLSQDLPVVLSFRLGKLVKLVDPVLKTYEELRQKLVTQYAEPDEKGNRQVPPGKMVEFASKLKLVLAEDAGLDVVDIPEVKLSDLEGLKMTSQEMAALTPWLVKE